MTSVRNRLLADRKALLDLGTRNRLIHIPLRTKNIRAIEIVNSFAKIAGGNGGYWEDQGYDWYAGS